jgi:AAA+ superfamily predicted ATPase
MGKGETQKKEVLKPVSKRDVELVKELSTALSSIFKNKVDLLEDHLVEYTKSKGLSRNSMVFAVPLYQKWQACNAVFSFLRDKTTYQKICSFNYDCDKLAAPTYTQIEIKREVRKPVLVRGWFFFKHQGVGYGSYLDYEGKTAELVLYYNKKHEAPAIELINELRTYMQEHNIFKNERLKVTDGVVLEFLEYPKLSFDDIILEKKLKEEIFLNLIFPLNNEELCKEHKIPWRRGIILGGSPGTGKTKLAKVLCNVLKCTVIWVTTESITGPYDVKMVFEAARYLNPTLMVFEDIDFLGKDRELEHSPVLGELLNQLDGNAPNHGIFVLASSNRPGLLDKALANRPGRFDVQLELNPPEINERRQLIQLFSKDKKLCPDWNPEDLALKSNGLTGAHIQELFTYATLYSLQQGAKTITSESLNKALIHFKEKPNSLSR